MHTIPMMTASCYLRDEKHLSVASVKTYHSMLSSVCRQYELDISSDPYKRYHLLLLVEVLRGTISPLLGTSTLA